MANNTNSRKRELARPFNNIPYETSDFRPIYKQNPFSKDDKRPIAGIVARMKYGSGVVDAEIVSYFNDDSGEEHVLVRIGPIMAIRRTTDLES